MARYPQGISTFIPQIQPYQVDFNFVNNVLQTKQAQYDQGWKQLNKLYGQIYYADLTHGDSKAKQKDIVKEIDFNLKRVAGLDLSLSQNVQAASQVFQPFYQDGNLMKDMAWTKNTKAQLNNAEVLRTSSEEDVRAQYWRTGVDAINYKKQEFQESPYDKIQSMRNVTYTPYVDVMKKAEEITKEYGDTVTPSFEGGKWIVKTTNGEQLIEPLTKLLNIRLGGDPFVKDMYQTQAYVQRKNYVNSEAAKFNGDKGAAERSYLEDGYNRMKNSAMTENQRLKSKSRVYQEQIEALAKKSILNDYDPEVSAAIRELEYNKSVIDQNLERSNSLVASYNTGESNGTTSTGYEDPFEDLAGLRRKVDGLVANDLFNRDSNQAAITYAYRNYKQEVEKDPYGLADYQHQLKMKEKEYEADRAEKLKMDELKLDTGDFRLQVDADGTTTVVTKDERFYESAEMLVDPGFTTGALTGPEATKIIVTDEYRDQIMPALNQSLNIINESGIDKENLSSYFGGENLDNLVAYTKTIESFDKALSEGKITGTREEALERLNKSIESFYGVTSNREIISDKYKGKEAQIQANIKAVHDAAGAMNAYGAWNKKAMASIASDAMSKGNYSVASTINEDGSTRTVREWAQNLRDLGQITESTKNNLIANGGNVTYRARKIRPTGHGGDNLTYIYDKFLGAIGARDFGGKGQGLIPNILPTKKDFETGYYEDVNGNRLTSYKQSIEGLKNYKIDYKALGPSPILSGQLNPGDATALSNIRGTSIVVAGEGGGYERFGKDIFQNLNSLDYGDSQQTYGTFRSPAFEGDYSALYANPTRGNVRAILDRIESEMQNDDSKVEFKVIGSPIAGMDPNKASVTFKASDPGFWDDLVYKKDAKGNVTGGGVISAEEASLLKTNGLSVVSDRSLLNNSLLNNALKGNVMTIAENSEDNSYTYVNPFDNRYTTNVELNPTTNNVRFNYTYPVFNPQTLQIETQTFTDPIINPGNLDQRVSMVNDPTFIQRIRNEANVQAETVKILRERGMSDDEIRKQLEGIN